tara:strand:- start:1302 stop:1514 length:213 start_codon:yes stop_codon:yes gene_type:complete
MKILIDTVSKEINIERFDDIDLASFVSVISSFVPVKDWEGYVLTDYNYDDCYCDNITSTYDDNFRYFNYN